MMVDGYLSQMAAYITNMGMHQRTRSADLMYGQYDQQGVWMHGPLHESISRDTQTHTRAPNSKI